MKKIVATFTLLALLTACGGDGGGRPSEDDIAKALKDKDNAIGAAIASTGGGEVTDDIIDCIAKALHESDVSDDALQAIVDNDEDYKGSDKDAEALQDAMTTDLAKCITG